MTRAIKAVDSIRTAHPGIALDLVPLDIELASLQSIRDFVGKFHSLKVPLHLLILNAGVMAIPERATTRDGFETQMGVNHIGHFYLAKLLLSHLLSSQPSRVVSVTSNAHFLANTTFISDPNLETEYDPWTAYGNSKFANILFAKYFNRLYEYEGVTAVSVHPGGIFTGLQVHMSPTEWRSILFQIVAPFLFKSPTQGAATSVYTAISPSIVENKLGGRYFEDCHVSRTHFPNMVEDDDNGKHAKLLWHQTEKLLKSRLTSSST
eukprot:TRINITY_DN8581_c0_g1_i3.p1 TRINITY_DN8581_c0_g1~~TRINITY_DN8581_c0_g1_i3.p1  ORF type:complete len:264 (+),score=25.19 TRINITY_DN8581_c0_g1_i3:268-1059(+)